MNEYTVYLHTLNPGHTNGVIVKIGRNFEQLFGYQSWFIMADTAKEAVVKARKATHSSRQATLRAN